MSAASLSVVGCASPRMDREREMHRGPITDEQRARMPQLFKKGQSGNPKGASSITMLRTHENARRAVAIREKMLSTLESRIATIEVMVAREFSETPELIEQETQVRIMLLLTPDVNRLLTDSENRGLGAPRQVVDIDATAVEDRRRPEEYSDEELAEILEGEFTTLGYVETRIVSDRFLSTPLPSGEGEE